jgi:hypothetical protein
MRIIGSDIWGAGHPTGQEQQIEKNAKHSVPKLMGHWELHVMRTAKDAKNAKRDSQKIIKNADH